MRFDLAEAALGVAFLALLAMIVTLAVMVMS